MTDPKLPPENEQEVILKLSNKEVKKVVLDRSKLAFNEATINQFQENLALWYDHYCEMFCLAELIQTQLEHGYEVAYAKVYAAKKDEGCTEKQAEAYAKIHPDIVELKRKIVLAKNNAKRIERHVRSWDKAHENAQNRGHTIRREMDKLNSDIYFKNRELASKVDEIIK